MTLPTLIENHPDLIAARANADLRRRGVSDLRHDTAANRPQPDTAAQVRRARQNTTAKTTTTATEPAPAPPPTPAETMRARLSAVLRAPEARGRITAAFALAVNTDMTVDQIKRTLRDLPAGVDLQLPTKASADPAARAEADRVRQIVLADAAVGREDQAMVLALDILSPTTTALAILSATPKRPRVATIEERAAAEAEFGPSTMEMHGLRGKSRAAAGWSSAVAQANARFENFAPAQPTLPDDLRGQTGQR